MCPRLRVAESLCIVGKPQSLTCFLGQVVSYLNRHRIWPQERFVYGISVRLR